MDPFKLLGSSKDTQARDLSLGLASRPSRKRKREWSQHEGSTAWPGQSQRADQDVIPHVHPANPNDLTQEPSANLGVVSHDATSPQSALRGGSGGVLKAHKIKIAQIWTPLENDRKKRESGAKLSKKRSKQLSPDPLLHFTQLSKRYNVPKALAKNLEDRGFARPTDVQMASLPLLMSDADSGDRDVTQPVTPPCHLLSVAPTGSGKTLAFLVPTMHSIVATRRLRKASTPKSFPAVSSDPSALILAPTKELAKQTVNEARKLTHMTGIRVTLVNKGMNLAGDKDQGASDDDNALLVKADVLVSTPQALLNAARRTGEDTVSFPNVSMLILDEADVLLDPLFRDQTMSVWASCTRPSLQVSLWSATMGSNIEEITRNIITQRNASSHLPLNRLVVGLKDSSIPNIDHRLVYAASEPGKLTALRQLLHSNRDTTIDLPKIVPPFLVFTQTIPRAIALHAELLYDMPAEAGGSSRIAVLHADLSDTARDRTMSQFRKGEIWVLITTDLLARGVDFRGMNGVVNYDLPNSSAAYVHRVGRTGRAGREGGVALTLYSKDDLPFVKNVANVIAATERMSRGERESLMDSNWILDNLPKVTKRDKQRLKQHGVESRRRRKDGKGGKGRPKTTQISTKSAFERREESRKKAAAKGRRTRQTLESAVEEDFHGFDD